jgi:hypothetical protein
MRGKRCFYCKQRFQPSRYRPDQSVCSSPNCQRRRRNDYHRKKIAQDLTYREQCRDSQKNWRERNPRYMPNYRARRRVKEPPTAKSDLPSELRRLLKVVKNNVALDLKSFDGSAWLVCPSAAIGAKNNLASAQIIVLQGVLRVAK